MYISSEKPIRCAPKCPKPVITLGLTLVVQSFYTELLRSFKGSQENVSQHPATCELTVWIWYRLRALLE